MDQECTDVEYYHRDPFKLVSVHHNSIKIWHFDDKSKKLKYLNCALGKINRFITCVSIDNIDNFAYCGTRSGDIMEISLTKGIYQRSGPVNKKIKGCVN